MVRRWYLPLLRNSSDSNGTRMAALPGTRVFKASNRLREERVKIAQATSEAYDVDLERIRSGAWCRRRWFGERPRLTRTIANSALGDRRP